ncbi:hypothetical protein ANOM_011764, partial [Aspergillus nomiae NRRL 13137]
MNPTLNADTPPPPPPKPTSHEASRRGTPQLHASQPGTPQSQRYRADASMHAATNINPGTSLPRPPTVDEGWIPEIVKEKSYASLFLCFDPTVDLQTILKDPSLISALASRHPSHAAHQEYLQALLKYNKDLAAHVLELQGRVMDLRGSTETLLLTHQSLEVSWRKKQSEMDAALAPWSPKALYQRLAASIAEQEAVCHAVEESFLEGEHHGRATEKEVADWIRRVRAEGAKLEARREAKA